MGAAAAMVIVDFIQYTRHGKNLRLVPKAGVLAALAGLAAVLAVYLK